MIAGKLKRVVQGLDSLEELVREVDEGYILLSWREESNVLTAYLLIKDRNVVGLVVEDVLKKEVFEGRDGVERLRNALNKGSIKVAEIYEANVQDILSDYPKSKISWTDLIQELPGRELHRMLMITKKYKGVVNIHDESKSWAILIEGGIPKAAKTIKGPKLHGNGAFKDLLKEMGDVLKHGKYKIGGDSTFSDSDFVKEGAVFREGLELLNEKLKFEEKIGKK